MPNPPTPIQPFSRNSVRVNFILKNHVAQKFFDEIPSGKRSSLVCDWIEEGLKYRKHQKAVERIRQLREEGAKIPDRDKTNSTEILREFRYAR